MLLFPAAGTRGQDRPPISVEATIVTVDTAVRDAHGQIVSNLTKDDFALDEDGRPQTITYFARENDLPLTIGLLVDTSLSQRRALDQERKTSYTFLDHTMRPEKDKAFLIHFDRKVELLKDVTSSRQKLESALGLLQTPRPAETSEGGEHHKGGGTLLYDAVFLASDEVMKKQQGRKALIVLTDGVDRNSKETLADAIEAAQRANTVVYAVLFKGEQPYDEHGGWGMGGHGGGRGGGPHTYPQEARPDGKKILERITKETGGRLFEVSKKQPVDDIYAQIEQELRSQYVLGYSPVKVSDAADYRKIHVVTVTKGLIVQARDGYYSAP
jgi:VWFA-related protein